MVEKVDTQLSYTTSTARDWREKPSESPNHFMRLSAEQGVTVVTATHDHKMLANSDRVLWIRDGMVERIDRRDQLRIDEGELAALHSPEPEPRQGH